MRFLLSRWLDKGRKTVVTARLDVDDAGTASSGPVRSDGKKVDRHHCRGRPYRELAWNREGTVAESE